MEKLQYIKCLYKVSVSLSRLTFFFVKPADAAAVVMRLEEQLSEELPQVDGLAGVVAHHIRPGVFISC